MVSYFISTDDLSFAINKIEDLKKQSKLNYEISSYDLEDDSFYNVIQNSIWTYFAYQRRYKYGKMDNLSSQQIDDIMFSSTFLLGGDSIYIYFSGAYDGESINVRYAEFGDSINTSLVYEK